jgi:hypothetical protein
LSVSRFDPDSEDSVVLSERTWLISLQADPNLPSRPNLFQFGRPKREPVEAVYQRYRDADLVDVEATVSLEERYGRSRYAWLWWTALGVVAAGALAVVAVRLARRPAPCGPLRFELPDPLTPFTVLGLLRQMEANNGFTDDARRELLASIARLEQHFFAHTAEAEHAGEQAAPDLRQVAEDWIHRAV